MKQRITQLLSILLFITGVGTLALSQIHILASTKIFAAEIGFYLFLFVIFGLTTGFNAVLIEKPRSIFFFILSGLLASGAGVIYLRILQTDVAAQDALTMDDVQSSFQMAIGAIVIYLLGVITIPVLKWNEIKLADTS